MNVELKDITDTMKDMDSGCSFLKVDPEEGLVPVYGKEIESLFLLSEWNLFGDTIGEPGNPEEGIKCFAALIPHGKIYIAEVFFMNGAEDVYLGSNRVFTVTFGGIDYEESFDDVLIDELKKNLWKGEKSNVY